MNIAFTLDMPGRASWNGRWSGEGSVYAIVKSVGRSDAAQAKALQIAEKQYYSYGWSDGWRASVTAKIVTAQEARKLRKQSRGFCGYEWMVDSIYQHGFITTEHDLKKQAEAATQEATV